MRKRITALLAAALLLGGLCAPAAAQAQESTLTISTPEQLQQLARDCSSDTYSVGLTVYLANDIDAGGKELSIPTFAGVFDGQGYTIRGIHLSQEASPAGFFAYVQPSAVVRNLKVVGQVAPSGDVSYAGGIAGRNSGTIENCTFSGTVSAAGYLGGIAGRNEESGVISGCISDGVVHGTRYVGGIAGENGGTLSACNNAAAVSTTVTDTSDPQQTLADLTDTVYRLFQNRDSVAGDSYMSDIGGIAGNSTGSVTGCVNSGPVGYPHVGYNIGGIAGQQSGHISNCINRGTVQGRKDVGGIVGQMVPDISIQYTESSIDALQGELAALQTLLDQTAGHAESGNAAVSGHVSQISDYADDAQSSARDIAGQLRDWADTPDPDTLPDCREESEALNSSLSAMFNELGALGEDMSGSGATLSSDIKAVNRQFNTVMNLFLNLLSDTQDVNYTDVYEDVSDESIYSAVDGKLTACENRGTVSADLNVGGIAGSMAIEYDTDPEDDLLSSGQRTSHFTYETKAILLECRNYGAVTARKNCAGSVVGRMDLGTVYACGGYGSTESESGNYVGGVAGYSLSSIRRSFAKCPLSGQRFMGGIAGSGSRISDCRSMVEITDCIRSGGGVAGELTGEASGNYFVSDTLAGIDRISYAGKAEKINYETLCALEGIPSEFLSLTVTFMADGSVLRSETLHYGDSLPADAFPILPQKDGYYAHWDKESLTDLHFDQIVSVVYTTYLAALPSQQTRDGKPDLFAVGQFRSGDELTSKTLDSPAQAECSGALETWQLSMPADGLDSHEIRYLPPEDAPSRLTVYVRQADGSWARVEHSTFGSYLTFRMDGSEGAFCVVASAVSYWLAAVLAAAALLAVLGLVLLLRKKRRRNASKPASQATQ